MAQAAPTREMPSPAQAARMLGGELWSEMETNLSVWRLIGEFIYPWRCMALEQGVEGGHATRRSRKIINTSAGLAFNSFRAGMLAGNSSPSTRWFKITLPDERLASGGEAKEFLRELEELTYKDLGESNAYRALSLIYGDEGLFGTGAMLPLADEDDPLRCYTFPIGTYAIGQDSRGVVDKFYREYEMTAEQMEGRFGYDKLSTRVQQLLNTVQGSQTKVGVCHLIAPNRRSYGERASESRGMPWKECYFESGGDRRSYYGEAPDAFLSESGFKKFPVITPRWDDAGSETPWGVGVGLQILSDVMQLQVMQSDLNSAVEQQANPAVQGPGSMKGHFINRRPGKYTAVDVAQGGQKIEKLVDIDVRLDHVAQLMLDIRQRTDEAFFKDLFKQFTGAPDRLPKTAYLAQKMFQEKAGNLLPAMEQQYDELLSPLLDRVIQIRIDSGRMPAIPRALSGVPLKFEYISPFAEAQRSMKTGGTETFLSLVAALQQSWPEAGTYIDIGEAIEELADGYTIPPRLLRSAKEVAAIMEAQAAAMQQAAQVQAAPQMAKAAKDLSETQVNGGSALDAMAEIGM